MTAAQTPGAVTVRVAADADRPAWDAFVAARPEGDPLQLWAWGEVRAAEGEPPLRLVAARGDGTIAGVAGLLVRPTSFGRTVMYAPHGPLWTREAPDGPAILAALVEGAGLVYLSGGNPAYLAETLRGTAVWQAIVAAHEAGAALAGCSAGAMALSSWAPRMRDLVHPDQPTGLGLVENLRVIPHFDKMLGWVPDVLRNALLHKPEGTMLVGIDEDTALVGGPHEWTVQGRQSVWELGEGKRIEHKPGTTLTTP